MGGYNILKKNHFGQGEYPFPYFVDLNCIYRYIIDNNFMYGNRLLKKIKFLGTVPREVLPPDRPPPLMRVDEDYRIELTGIGFKL